ncbi:MAG: T9SS type A sorting domain-containing protein [Saprospiraceae bacterium]|nr:T9SS type A sorting domain-containing protein [Saprospiraceae bacterium]
MSGVYVTVSGFRFGEMKSQVYYSDNYGFSWSDIGQDLPDIPVNDIQLDFQNPEYIYLATDAGVFVSNDHGQDWRILGNGTEALTVLDLDYHINGTLEAATYGKGLMTYNLGASTSLSKTEVHTKISCYPNPTQNLSYLSEQGDWDYRLYDLTGKSYTVNWMGKALDLSALSTGLYYLDLTSKSDRSHLKTLKFVKI